MVVAEAAAAGVADGKENAEASASASAQPAVAAMAAEAHKAQQQQAAAAARARHVAPGQPRQQARKAAGPTAARGVRLTAAPAALRPEQGAFQGFD